MNDFYENNHQEYFTSTAEIDPSDFLEPLAGRLEPGAAVLDIGCGSGRDLLWFTERGFKPIGLEKSSSLANLARQYAHCPVIEGDFCTYKFSSLSSDALIFIGSLVHQPEEAVPAILESTCQALTPGGYILITMKEGTGAYSLPDGRKFTLWSKKNLEKIYAKCNLEIVDFFRQVSSIRTKDIWLSHVLRLLDES